MNDAGHDARHDEGALNGHRPNTGQNLPTSPWATHPTQPVHPDIEDQLAAYAAGDLAPAAHADVARHLAGCASCRASLAQTQHIRALLRSLAAPVAQPVAASVADGVLARLARSEATPDRRSSAASEADREEDEVEGGWSDVGYPEPTTTLLKRPGTTATPETRFHRPASNRRGALIPALAATAAIVLVSALLFGVFGAQLRPRPPVAHPTPSPRPSGPILPPYSTIMDMTMLSASDGWAVGSVAQGPASPRGPGAITSLILHYTGGQWQPVRDTFPDVLLESVAMYGPDDGWAVGQTMHTPLRGVVLRDSGGHWREVQVPTTLLPPPLPATAPMSRMIPDFQPTQVQAVGPDDAYVVVDAALGDMLILHDRQGSWTAVPTSPYFGAVPTIAMVSDDEGWITSYSGVIYHEHAGHWTADLNLGGSTTDISGLHMLSVREGWALATENDTAYGLESNVYGPTRLFLLHYLAGTWTTIQVPTSLYQAYQAGLTNLSVTPSGEVWISGSIGDQQSNFGTAFLLRYVEGHFEQITLPIRLAALTSLALATANDGWVLAGQGVSQVLLHYHNGVWTVASQNWAGIDDALPVNVSQAPGWQRYTDVTYGFTLEVPASYVTSGPVRIAEYRDQNPYLGLVFQGPYPTSDQIWVSVYTDPDADVGPGICQYVGGGTPITVGPGIAGRQIDRTRANPAPGIPGGVPAVEARFLSGGLYVDIQLIGQGPASTFMARYGATWQHVLASFAPGAAHPSAHACGS